MPFRTDDPDITIDPQEKAPMSYSRQDERDRIQARIDMDTAKEAQRPKTSQDARLNAIERAKRGENVGQGSRDARDSMINRMRERAQ